MHWDGFFEDLEAQLAAEWESERAVLDSETERLRVARLDLRSRLHAATAERAAVTVHACAGARARGELAVTGADWIGIGHPDASFTALPLAAVRCVEFEHGALLRSTLPVPASGVSARLTLGFFCRDLARRRAPLRLTLRGGEVLTGTIDRAGADHFDLAVHDRDVPRRAHEVRAFRLIGFGALAQLHVDDVRSAAFL